jgi:hypothetical protein
MRLVTFVRTWLSPGQRLSELFYGVVMAVILTGMINVGLPPTESTLRLLLFGTFAVNISWGVIDGVTSMYGGLANRADFSRTANAFRADPAGPEKREAVARALQGTIVENLDEAGQAAVVDMIGAGKPVSGQRYPPVREDWYAAIATIVIDFVLVFPVMAPYFIFNTVRWAVFVSHTISILMLAGIAVVWAGQLNLNTKKAGVIVGIISIIMIYSTYAIGW